jgi:ketosteroid isomerase-like protein
MAHANEDLVRKGYKAFGEGDMDTLRSLFAPDAVHVATLDQDETLTFTISGGKITRLVEKHSDQAAYDAFWS